MRFIYVAGLVCALCVWSCDSDSSGAGSSNNRGNCRSIDGEVEPVEAVSTPEYTLTGTYWIDGGDMKILLAPVVSNEDYRSDQDLDGQVTVSVNGSDTTFDSIKINDLTTPINGDGTFVIDTTGSMSWAIDGVKETIIALSNELEGVNINADFAGVEFGDNVRTSIGYSSPSDFRNWVTSLNAEGGDDLPENILDAMLATHRTANHRDNALRFQVIVTDVGFHEKGDCNNPAQVTLREAADELRGSVLPIVVHLNLFGGDTEGVPPHYIPDALGGVYFELSSSDIGDGFQLDDDLNIDGKLRHGVILTIAEENLPANINTVRIEYVNGGTTYSLEL